MIEERLGSDKNFEALSVVFSVDPQAGLQMRLHGEPVLVNAAKDRMGTEGNISKFDA